MRVHACVCVCVYVCVLIFDPSKLRLVPLCRKGPNLQYYGLVLVRQTQRQLGGDQTWSPVPDLVACHHLSYKRNVGTARDQSLQLPLYLISGHKNSARVKRAITCESVP